MLPQGIHQTVARMLMESTDRTRPVSDLKNTPGHKFMPDPEFAPDFDSALAAAIRRYRANPLPEPKKPSVTLSEAKSIPDDVIRRAYALLLGRT